MPPARASGAACLSAPTDRALSRASAVVLGRPGQCARISVFAWSGMKCSLPRAPGSGYSDATATGQLFIRAPARLGLDARSERERLSAPGPGRRTRP